MHQTNYVIAFCVFHNLICELNVHTVVLYIL